MENTEQRGRVDTDGMAKALLQYRNTPLLGIGFSPIQMLFGRPLKDALPSPPGSLLWNATTIDYDKCYGMSQCSSYWDYILAGRELGASKKLAHGAEYYEKHKRLLAQLFVGDSVQIQNREGNHPL